jgi:septum formation protein
MRIILASGSPRRRELLEMLKVENLEIIPAKGEEADHPELSPPQLVMELSRCKAAEIAPADEEDTITIGADTIVVLDGKVMGKPSNEGEAAEMLRSLSGRSHTVYTGVTVIRGSRVLSRAEETKVHFRSLSEREIDVLVHIVRGLTNKEIAAKMFLSVHTVNTHRKNIMNKLKIHSPAGLTIYAIVNKLVQLEDLDIK